MKKSLPKFIQSLRTKLSQPNQGCLPNFDKIDILSFIWPFFFHLAQSSIFSVLFFLVTFQQILVMNFHYCPFQYSSNKYPPVCVGTWHIIYVISKQRAPGSPPKTSWLALTNKTKVAQCVIFLRYFIKNGGMLDFDLLLQENFCSRVSHEKKIKLIVSWVRVISSSNIFNM